MTDLASELRALRHTLQQATARVDALVKSLDPTADDIDAEVRAMPRTRAIEHVLVTADGPMRPIEIWAELQRLGRDDPKSEVSVTAYDLAERGRIERPSHGLYRALPGSSDGGS
jgi:hypothetical protein